MVSLVEAGTANFSCDLGGRLISAVGVTIDLQYQLPHAEPRQRDAAHARCVAYVQRRLERDGWLVAREIEIGSPRSHGWIDLLAFDPRTRTLLVIEVKTQLDDVGRIERTVAWYVRGAPAAAMRLGWHAEAVGSWLLVLATDANEQRLRENRLTLAQSFPRRAPELDLGPGLALIDPRSRRRAWLIRTRVDGRRTPAPYANYAHLVRSGEGNSRTPRLPSAPWHDEVAAGRATRTF
jgi:Holliday junction resolvase